MPIVLSGQATPVAGTYAIDDMLLLEPAPGHTIGSTTFRVSSQGAHGLFIGDIMHHPIQAFFPCWNSRYCELPDLAVETRLRLLEQSAKDGAFLFPSHFVAPFYGRISSDGAKFGFNFAPVSERVKS